MPRGNPLVSVESVRRVAAGMRDAGEKTTLRAVRDKLGGGSLSDIQDALSLIKAEFDKMPPDVEDMLEPLVRLAAKLLREAMEKAAAELKERLDTLQLDNDELSGALAESEARNAELGARVKGQNDELIKRDALVSEANERNGKLDEALRLANAELIKRTIREEDYKQSKAEAVEAIERTAELKGQLEELRRRLAAIEAGPAVKGPAGKKVNKA